MEKHNFQLDLKSVGIFLIGLSFAFYFFIFLPSKEANKISLEEGKIERQSEDSYNKNLREAKEKCYSAGESFSKAEKNQLEAVAFSFLKPEFHYNLYAEKCLYLGGYVDTEGVVYRYIKDVYTNETLAEFRGKGNEAYTGNKDDFWLKKEELFKE